MPASAVLLSAGFFLSVTPSEAISVGPFIALAYAGAILLGVCVLVLGIGLLRAR
jgi:hypothetical protein